MADYGRTTLGATGSTIEARYIGRAVTIPAGEEVVSMSAGLQSAGSATNGWRLALYDFSTLVLVAQSATQTGFTDTTGAFRTAAVSVAAQGSPVTYWAIAVGDAVAGGGNTINGLVDVVASDTALRQKWFFTGTWPTLETPLTGLEVPDGTNDFSIYVTTTAGGGGGSSVVVPSAGAQRNRRHSGRY
jgi:hypothetical protein